MNRGIYTGATGMMTTSKWLDVVANNLANAGTDGYKADSLGFADVMNQNIYSNGGRGGSVGSLSSGPMVVEETVDRSVGVLKKTGNPLDVAFDSPNGMFAVQANGQTFFTRSGSFKINSSRELVTSQGQPVLNDRGNRIVVEGEGLLEISEDGEVMENGKMVAKLGIYEGNFEKAGKNLWRSDRPTALNNVHLLVGQIEGSNVQPIEAMVDLIKINRSYEQSQRSIQAQDELTTKLVDILNRR